MLKLPNYPILQTLKALDKKFLIDVGIRYAVVVLFVLIVLLPSCGRSGALKNKLNQTRAEVSTARAKITQAIHLQKNRDTFLGQINTMETKFFAEEELPQILAIISDLAKQNNLQMTASKPIQEKKEEGPLLNLAPKPGAPAGAKPAAPRPESFYAPHEYEVDLLGGYHALGGFLSALKKQPKLIQVKQLAILGSKTGPDHQIKLTIAVFSKVQGK